MSNQRKWKCCSCDGISIEEDLLRAVNPFDATMTIEGCPICKDVVGFTEICDEPECIRDASCGFPTPEGYRRTCGDHMRAAKQNGQADEFSGHAKDCVLRSGGYACTCGAVETTRLELHLTTAGDHVCRNEACGQYR